MVKRVVVACGQSKTDHATSAELLYTGPYFSASLAWAKSHPDVPSAAIRILSAKFGFVELETILQPYDVRFGCVGAIGLEDLCAQGEQLRWRSDDVVICGGIDYVMLAKQALGTGRGLGALMKHEMGGRPAGIGWQLSWFKRNAGRWPNFAGLSLYKEGAPALAK